MLDFGQAHKLQHWWQVRHARDHVSQHPDSSADQLPKVDQKANHKGADNAKGGDKEQKQAEGGKKGGKPVAENHQQQQQHHHAAAAHDELPDFGHANRLTYWYLLRHAPRHSTTASPAPAKNTNGTAAAHATDAPAAAAAAGGGKKAAGKQKAAPAAPAAALAPAAPKKKKNKTAKKDKTAKPAPVTVNSSESFEQALAAGTPFVFGDGLKEIIAEKRTHAVVLAICKALKNSLHVTSLAFADCDVGLEGARKLQPFLEKADKLERLALINANLNEESGNVILDAVKILKGRALTQLNFLGNQLGAKSTSRIAPLLAACKNLRVLKLEGRELGADAAAVSQAIAAFGTHHFDNLTFRAGLKEETGVLLANNLMRRGQVHDLDLSDNSLRYKGICSLLMGMRENPGKLYHLNLSRNAVGANDAPKILEMVARFNGYLKDFKFDDNGAKKIHLVKLANLFADKAKRGF